MSRIDDQFKKIYESLSLYDRDVLDRIIDRERKKERNKVITELVKSVHKLSYGNISETKKS